MIYDEGVIRELSNNLYDLQNRVYELEREKEHFKRELEWKVMQSYYSSQDYEANKDINRFEFVDIKKGEKWQKSEV